MSEIVLYSDALCSLFGQALDEKWGYIWGTAGVEWTASKQKQKVDYMKNKYGTNWQKNSEAKDDNYYRAALYGDKWIGHMVADCSGLFKWAFNKHKIYIAHGSNTIYLDYCSSKGTLSHGKRTDGQKMKPGTAVFVYDKSKNNYKHIGLFIGNNKVIEAATTDAGVCVSNVTANKWTHWGELKKVKYVDENSGFPADTGWRPTIRKGDKGEYVKEAQTMLYNLGYNLGKYGIDGDFGTATQAAVREFQRDRKLAQDGVVGPLTWDALQKATDGIKQPSDNKDEYYTILIKHLTKSQAETLKNAYQDCTIDKE